MLENGTDDNVVRWGDQGDSFVVLENEKFTKHILPKHFKHSNFASFVRQLNKYDFHKVRHNNEEGGGSPYGPGAWEFKHPDFKMNNKDALDNIRRKAPAARKPAPQAEDMLVPTHQMDMLNSQLTAVQQQVQTLEKQNHDLTISNSLVVQELMNLQKFVTNHEHVLQNVVKALGDLDAKRRRESKILFQSHGTEVAGGPSAASQLAAIEDEAPPSPLQHASKLLNETNLDVLMNTRNLEQMNEMSLRLNGAGGMPSPSELNGRGSSGSGPPSAGSTGTMRFAELDHLVYPVGGTNGINPMYPEHSNNIPYAINERALEPQHLQVQHPPKKGAGMLDPGWIRQPEILLVEDDQTCRRIGSKFLLAFNCHVTAAHDGLQAVEKHRENKQYDLVLMDIIMPNLDGCSAAHFIRQHDQTTPIIAMTSNIRSDDIAAYYNHGMNDILPKPFTKEGLLQVLEKHLFHLRKPEGLHALSNPSPAAPVTAMTLPRPGGLKEEDSPQKSPATISSWTNSPSHTTLQGMSPITVGTSVGTSVGSVAHDEYTHMAGMPSPYGIPHPGHPSAMPQLGPNGVPYTPTGPPRRHIDQISGGEDINMAAKRQQIYGAPPMNLGRR
ncbi:response regulator [Microthyrium microscopicum]|uniref:Transcription factor n=1 Tax=Microthyrium microscopicum TaxID=703497 RepID=A0A6A6UEM5_9PEZI|nr:response regulator [Microthyrium microscopicum]